MATCICSVLVVEYQYNPYSFGENSLGLGCTSLKYNVFFFFLFFNLAHTFLSFAFVCLFSLHMYQTHNILIGGTDC